MRLIIFVLSIWVGLNQVAKAQTSVNEHWRLMGYGSLKQPVPSLSKPWTDTELGIGMAWGVGGGIYVQWPLARWLAVGLNADYGQWQVERRFFESTNVKFSSDQAMRQLALMATIRIYPVTNFFIQPMGGGQILQVTHLFSDSYPGQNGAKQIQVLRPMIGGMVGYEYYKNRFVSEIGIQYQLTPNQFLQTLEGPFHTIGLRLGIGWQAR